MSHSRNEELILKCGSVQLDREQTLSELLNNHESCLFDVDEICDVLDVSSVTAKVAIKSLIAKGLISDNGDETFTFTKEGVAESFRLRGYDVPVQKLLVANPVASDGVDWKARHDELIAKVAQLFDAAKEIRDQFRHELHGQEFKHTLGEYEVELIETLSIAVESFEVGEGIDG